jgi:hypothetical protein
LLLAPEYSLNVQAWIPAALAAIHNFISIHNPHDQPISNTTADGAQAGNLYINDEEDVAEAPGPNKPNQDLRRDMIAQKMWDDYVGICAERGINMDDLIESDLVESDNDD